MSSIAILKSRGMDNSLFLNMWIRAFEFWDMQYSFLYAENAGIDDFNKYEVLLITGVDYIPDETYRILDMYLEDGGNILVSGGLPDGLSKYFNGLKVKRIQRDNVHRCMRIQSKNGFHQWGDGEILLFTGTFNCNGVDYVTGDIDINDAEIPAVSEEMAKSCKKPGLWTQWRGTADPAIIIKNYGRGKILFTPFAIGAMTGMYHPVSADSISYLYAKENHGLYLLIRSLLMQLAENCEFREIWPSGARCVVAITGDVHDYTGIPGREDREWNDMLYNFNLLGEYGLEGKATFFICGEVARKHPDVIREGLKRGYELCPHTFKETQYAIEGWDYSKQQEDIDRCVKVFENAAPEFDCYKKGFRAHGYQSNHITRKVLTDMGFEYIADMQAWEATGEYNPDYPEKLINFAAYPQFAGDNYRLLEIPDTFANDHFVYRIMKMSPSEALSFWKKQFDKAYRLGGLFQACLHPYISLKEDPERENTYRQLLEYIISHPSVSFMTMNEISKWWFKRFKSNG